MTPHPSLRIDGKPSTVSEPAETRERFRGFLKQALYEKGGFAEGGEVTLEFQAKGKAGSGFFGGSSTLALDSISTVRSPRRPLYNRRLKEETT